MQKTWILYTLLVEKQNGATALGNSLAIPQKIKQSYHDPAIPLLKYLTQKTKDMALQKQSNITHNGEKWKAKCSAPD